MYKYLIQSLTILLIKITIGLPQFNDRMTTLVFVKDPGRHLNSTSITAVPNDALMLNGSIEELKNITKEELIKSMWAISKMDLSLAMKNAIWKIIKANKTTRVFRKDTIEELGTFLLSISDKDLFNLNVSDWGIVDYLGTFQGLSRRQTGVVAYALKGQWGDSIITSTEYINRIKGIICGFSPQDIDDISPLEFSQISTEVFENIGACTPRQKRVLFYKATCSSAYGPPEAWSSNDTERLGLLISIMDVASLGKIRPEAMEGIIPRTINAMSREQLDSLSEEQIDFMSDLSLTAYRTVMGIASSQLQIIPFNFLLISFFCWLARTSVIINS